MIAKDKKVKQVGLAKLDDLQSFQMSEDSDYHLEVYKQKQAALAAYNNKHRKIPVPKIARVNSILPL